MVFFRSVFVFATVASAMFIQNRDINTILSNMAQVDAAFKKAGSDCNAWDGSSPTGTVVANDLKLADDKLRSATSEAKTEAPLTSADSKTVLAYLASPLTPHVKAALDAFVKRKSDFQKDGLTSLAKNNLQSLKTDFDAYGAALVSLVSADQKTTARQEVGTIDGYFNSAIAAFS